MVRKIAVFFLSLKYGQARANAIYTLRSFINHGLPHMLGLTGLKSLTNIGTAEYYCAKTTLGEVLPPLRQALSHLETFQSPVKDFIIKQGEQASLKASQSSRKLSQAISQAIAASISSL